MLSRRMLVKLSLALPLMGAVALPTLAQAQSWPSESIRLLIGSSPGGNADVVARIIAAEVTARTGQNVVVENMAAASGMRATEAASEAEPDGYTWLFGTASHLVHNLALFDPLPVDISTTLRGAALINEAPGVLVVRADYPADDLAGFIEHAKANPDKVIIGSGPVGTTTHIIGLLFADQADVDVQHLAFPASPEAMRDVIAGRIDAMFDISVTALPHVSGGEARGLGVSSASRLPQAPDLPTMSEAGLKDFVAGTWNSIALPAGTPDAIVAEVNALINDIVQSPEMKARLTELGTIVPDPLSPEEVDAYYTRERETWIPIVREASAKTGG